MRSLQSAMSKRKENSVHMRRVNSESRMIVREPASNLFPSFKSFEKSRRSFRNTPRKTSTCDCDDCLFGSNSSFEEEKIVLKCGIGTSNCSQPCLTDKTNNDRAMRLWRKLRNVIFWINFRPSKVNRRWIQLAGHEGNFIPARNGFVWKRHNNYECTALDSLMSDVLRPYVAEFYGVVEIQGDHYLQLQDLLNGLDDPFMMDCKMGHRTFLEHEIQSARNKPELRPDLYQKMLQQDISAPTMEENKNCAVTKLRYMQWRDVTSSTSKHGFRIEAMRNCGSHMVKNYRQLSSMSQLKAAVLQYTNGDCVILRKYLMRLRAIRATVEMSPFFKANEVIGSSLLFLHDRSNRVWIWMIDFAKTMNLPANVQVNHRSNWKEGNHEDGYLLGLDNLITVFTMVLKDLETVV